MAKLIAERKGMELRYFKNNSKNETYGFELQGGLEAPAVEPGDMIALTEEEVFVNSMAEVWKTMDLVEINKKTMRDNIKNVGKQVVDNQNYDQYSDLMSKSDEEIINAAYELKSLSKLKGLKEKCENVNKGYLLIKELCRAIDNFGKGKK